MNKRPKWYVKKDKRKQGLTGTLNPKATKIIFTSDGEKTMKRLVFILVLLIFASSAWATVYKWTDEGGVVNFADNLDKVPPAYRNDAEEVKTPKMPAQTARTATTSTNAPPISQTLIREGDFAIKLAEGLKAGQAQSEAEAENILASSGIAPKNGWIADYPVTPDIIGELQNTITEAAASGKLAMKKDEATKVFQDLIGQQGLPVRAEGERQYAGAEQPYAEEAPPQDYPQYYEPSAINDYYDDQGPPVVSYYPPPPDYGYLYAWVPYPFWFSGFWFPGFFCLHDFQRVVFFDGHRRFISNHFWDSRTRGLGSIDPARRHMGNSMTNMSHPTRGFTSRTAANGASSLLRRSIDHAAINHPGGTSHNRVGNNQSNFRSRPGSVRSSTGYRPPSTGYSPRRRVPSSNPTYGRSVSHSGSFSHPGMGTGRSFSPPARSGSFGSHGGSFGSRGFSGGGGKGFSGGGGRGSSGGGGRGHR